MNDNIHLLLTHDKNDPNFKLYLKILNIQADDFNDPDRLVKSYGINETMFVSMVDYVSGKKTYIKKLEKYSDEQLLYITNPSLKSTKLIACPGGGKTRCILARMHYMIYHKFCKRNELFALTFSRSAAVDFKKRAKQLFSLTDFYLGNFSTIDALARSIIHGTDIETLSYEFREYLRNTKKFHPKLRRMKHLFVDEAQDLNQIQYDIITLLRRKLGVVVHFVGDLNQNIYQFRGSSDKYLMDSNFETFKLTTNYRSAPEIIEFFSDLRPNDTGKIHSVKLPGRKVRILNTSDDDIYKFMINYIREYKGDLSEIAIIAPTRGIKPNSNNGLSVYFNLLHIHGIKVNQGYGESSSSSDESQISNKIKPGCVNLFTIHGTKGLEFSTVFFVDCYQSLFNITPTQEQHNQNRYLLYVACSRAINDLFVCVSTKKHGGQINNWISMIDHRKYDSDRIIFGKTNYRKETVDQTFGITSLVRNLESEQLFRINDFLKIFSSEEKIYESVNVDRGADESLFGIFLEELYYLQYSLSRKKIPRQLDTVKRIINDEFIIVDDEFIFSQLKKYSNITWKQYDNIQYGLPPKVKDFVKEKFTRDKEFYSNVVAQNKFSDMIKDYIPYIRRKYKFYLDPENYDWDYSIVIDDFFYLIVVSYSYDINHYYYITNYGDDKKYLLKNGKKLFKRMNDWISKSYFTIKPKIEVRYEPLQIFGEIDYLENDDTICEIKAVNDITIRHKLQAYLYHFCYYSAFKNPDKIMKIYSCKVKLINLLTGVIHQLLIRITPKNLFKFMMEIADAGELKWNGLNIVCHESFMKDYRTEMIITNKGFPRFEANTIMFHGEIEKAFFPLTFDFLELDRLFFDKRGINVKEESIEIIYKKFFNEKLNISDSVDYVDALIRIIYNLINSGKL